ncbi:MAG TPA: TOPRIM nucleotidyl transferase/hydrolase domain-containing protein [Candidatus Hypogeohydataceae bacterium YC41]
MYPTFKTFVRFRKNLAKQRFCSRIGKRISPENQIKFTSRFDENTNEVFFAKHVILVEGSADKIACRSALEKLGIELDKESVSIGNCGSNTAIEQISKVLKLFNIPTYALIDKDPGNGNTRKIRLKLESILGDKNVFLQKPNLEGMFSLSKKPSKAEALKFFPQWFKTNSLPEVYKALKQKITGSQ